MVKKLSRNCNRESFLRLSCVNCEYIVTCHLERLTIFSTHSRMNINSTASRGRENVVMAEIRLGEVESRFADIIWQNEPLSSGELARRAEAELGWKESTSYTILKRLCERGLFRNVKRTVTSLISKEEFYAMQSEKFVEDTFDGSLPAFLVAFGRRKKYTDEEVEKMKRILDSMRG